MITRRFITSLMLLSGWLAAQAAAQTDSPAVVVPEENPDALTVLTEVEKPFVFIYGTWNNQVKIENGTAMLHCANSRGAAGINENMSASPEQRPILRILIGANNKAKILRLALRDTLANTGVWDYDLSNAPKGVYTFIRPVGNSSLATPTSIDKKEDTPGEAPNPAKLTQWKICGDWSDEPLDVDISVILLE